MSDTPKRSGADCPSCRDPWPAEFAQRDKSPRWSCKCGAGGPLLGEFFGRTRVAAPPPAQVKRHWRGP